MVLGKTSSMRSIVFCDLCEVAMPNRRRKRLVLSAYSRIIYHHDGTPFFILSSVCRLCLIPSFFNCRCTPHPLISFHAIC